MNLAPLTILTLVGGEDLLRTNPVLAIDLLLADWQNSVAYRQSTSAFLQAVLAVLRERQIGLPRAAVQRWAHAGYLSGDFADQDTDDRPTPRVLGLGTSGDLGFVLPLRPVAAARWQINATLPFTHSEILNVLVGLLQSTGIPAGDVIPERLAYRLENPLGLRFVGSSMTVACSLSILDQLGGEKAPLFGAAVALVEQDQEDRLRPVSDIPVKLAAALRECDWLSLVVVHPDSEFDRSNIETIWEVRSLADLASRLHTAGRFDLLLAARGALTRVESRHVLDRLKWLVHEHRYREAAEFGNRIHRVGPAGSPEPATWTAIAQLHAAACRHHGWFTEAVCLADKTYQRLAVLGELGSDDDDAEAAAEFAAALFSSHRFAEISGILSRWVTAIESEPRRFRPLTRVKVWNTLGRALAILGQPGWDDLFGRSLILNRGLGDDDNIDRTTNYRVHAKLRHRDITGAREALAQAQEFGERVGFGNPWAKPFLRATLARLEGSVWTDPVLEERLAAGERPDSVWLYVQATARQSPREKKYALRRLEMAVNHLRSEARGVAENVCNLFASFLEMNAAARSADANRWAEAIEEAREFLSDATHHRAYYGPTLDALPAAPDLSAAEALLDRVPYF